MRLLVPLPFDISNLAQGRNLRIAHLLPALQPDCDVLCVTPDARTAAAARHVMPDVEVRAAGAAKRACPPDPVIGRESLLVRRSLSFLGYDAGLTDAIDRLTATADVVAGFDMPSVAYLVVAAAARGKTPRPRIVCDLIDDSWLLRKITPRGYRWSWAGLKAVVAMQVIRHRLLGRIDALIAVAPQDAARLSRASGRPAAVVPNGVDADGTAAERWPREPLVVFTGNMNFPANVAAARFMARQVWPLVLASRRCGLGPDEASGGPRQPTLAIVGTNPVAAVRELAELPNVIVTGRVPTIREWLARAQVAVAPMLSGTGIKNKILEACAAGCPVVATTNAVGGLPTGEDAGIIIADGPERIAAEVFRVLADTEAARRIGSAGLEMARTHFPWTRMAAAFLEVLRGNAGPRAGADKASSTQHPTGERQAARNKEALAHAAS